jgi:hypothetical protein
MTWPAREATGQPLARKMRFSVREPAVTMVSGRLAKVRKRSAPGDSRAARRLVRPNRIYFKGKFRDSSMQPQGSTETQMAPPPSTGSGSGGGSGKAGLATALAAVAIAIAVVAVGINFVIPGPTGGKGSTGAAGITGSNGTQGPPYDVFYAVINGTTGDVIRGSGVNASTTLIEQVGGYQVVFDQNISNCSWFGSIGYGNTSGSAPPGFIGIVGRDSTSYGIWVTTYNVTGVATDEPFHVSVVCNAGLWALINADASIARSSGVTSAASEGTGEFQVIFDQDVTDCSYIVSPGLNGSIGSTAPYFVGVTGRLGNPDGVWVTTYDDTGVATNESFFIEAIC